MYERFLNRYLPEHHMFANLHCRLREDGSLNENRRGFGRHKELRDADNTYVSTRAAARDLGIRNHVDVWNF